MYDVFFKILLSIAVKYFSLVKNNFSLYHFVQHLLKYTSSYIVTVMFMSTDILHRNHKKSKTGFE